MVFAQAAPGRDAPGDATHGRTPASGPERGCIDIEVNGQQVRDYDCLGKLLMPSADSASRPPAQLRSEEIAGRPPTALGLANPEATRQRMGNTFGKSTLPQRPPQPPPTLPPTIRRP
ncbi:hypothetical protein [Luteimonas sp. R10]|uniref:hypothetical protein n=1 Tax=Luteimonas sp. R10 TaxID=3108176 RepID=UPI00308B2D97|nr:hypothetical protein U3649_14565 [Luteimonas sp. R10]